MERSRKKFLKNFFIGATSVPFIPHTCKKDVTGSSDDNSGGGVPVRWRPLKRKEPDITDNLGCTCLSFSDYRFEIINSDIKNREMHRVTINFFSKPVFWHDSVGQNLLVSPVESENETGEWMTSLVPVQPFLSIYSLKEN